MSRKKSAEPVNGTGGTLKAYLGPHEVGRMQKAATCFRDRLLVGILFQMGCRISEALALRVEDIDFKKGTVTIEHLKTRLRLSCPQCGNRLGRSHKFCPNCGNSVEKAVAKEKEHRRVRTLPVDDHTLEMLHDFITRDKTRGLIFKISRHRAWQVVRNCAEKAGLPDLLNPETGRIHGVSPHRLRDCFAVMAVQRDSSTDSVRMLQEWLGHANIGTTMRYRKVSGQELREWRQQLWKEKSSG